MSWLRVANGYCLWVHFTDPLWVYLTNATGQLLAEWDAQGMGLTYNEINYTLDLTK